MPPRESNPAIHVVVIDDDVDHLAILESQLKRVQMRIEVLPFASSGDAAAFFQRFSDSGFPWPLRTAIFCDVRMPGLSGFDILKQVRSYPALADTPLFMISGTNDASDRAKARELGATACLMKMPTTYELQSLLTTVNESGLSSQAGNRAITTSPPPGN